MSARRLPQYGLRRPRVWLCAVLFSLLVGCSLCHAAEEVFRWRQFAGQTLRVLFSNHPYAKGMIRQFSEFEELTGIRLVYSMYPEDHYLERLERSFEKEAFRPDVYMIGAYHIWEYAPSGRMQPLDDLLLNPALTRVNYNVSDFFPRIIGSLCWTGQAGDPTGQGPIWALPIGFEFGTLIYNREVFAQHRMSPPNSMAELIAAGKALNGFNGPDSYGVAMRGMGEWSTIHSGYLSVLANYGGTDMDVENGRLVSRLDSPQAVEATELWVRLLTECGPPKWEEYNWYRCLDDIGARQAAMLLDSSVIGFFANTRGNSSQAGKLGIALPPAPDGTEPEDVTSNLWVWGLAMNPDTTSPGAAWFFLQYFTSREFQLNSVLHWHSLNPPRQSVYEDPSFQREVSAMEGYAAVVSSLVSRSSIVVTPTPLYTDLARHWAETIRDIANGMYSSTQEGMDDLSAWLDAKLTDYPFAESE